MAYFSTYRSILFIIFMDILISITVTSFFVALFPNRAKLVGESWPDLVDFTSWKFFAQPVFSGIIFVICWRFAAPRVPSISATAKGIRFAIMLAMYSDITFCFYCLAIMGIPVWNVLPVLVDRVLRALCNGLVLSQLYRPYQNQRRTHFM